MVEASALESALKGIFSAMRDGSKDDDWLAGELAAAITTQIKTAGIKAGSVLIAADGGVANSAEIKVE
jgi:hypothetical protein